jgi:hypothetical protein
MIVAFASATGWLHASDMIGVYGRIDKVVMEPSDQAPQRIQVWGVFALADPKDPNAYFAPERGYLYYTLPANAKLALNEWNDLGRIAGTGQIVGFGTRWSSTPTRVRIRTADERPEAPDPYTMDIGLRKINGRTEYQPIRAILDFKP